MNVLGPYAAQQLLLHAIRPLVDSQMARCKSLHTGIPLLVEDTDETEPARDRELTADGPANTWPLGEILATRHDLQHSRIFNS
jgi:urease accessory protein